MRLNSGRDRGRCRFLLGEVDNFSGEGVEKLFLGGCAHVSSCSCGGTTEGAPVKYGRLAFI